MKAGINDAKGLKESLVVPTAGVHLVSTVTGYDRLSHLSRVTTLTQKSYDRVLLLSWHEETIGNHD